MYCYKLIENRNGSLQNFPNGFANQAIILKLRYLKVLDTEPLFNFEYGDMGARN